MHVGALLAALAIRRPRKTRVVSAANSPRLCLSRLERRTAVATRADEDTAETNNDRWQQASNPRLCLFRLQGVAGGTGCTSVGDHARVTGHTLRARGAARTRLSPVRGDEGQVWLLLQASHVCCGRGVRFDLGTD